MRKLTVSMADIKYKSLFSAKRFVIMAGIILSLWLIYLEMFFLPEIHQKRMSFGISCVRNFIVGVFKGWRLWDDANVVGLVERYNYFEVFLWGWIGILFITYFSIKGGRHRNRGMIAGVLFILFSISDAIEIQTGAWWSPAWLLLWKILNILGFIITYLNYRNALQMEK